METHSDGLFKADQHTGATNRKGLFTGGDIVTGPHLVVTAMVAGRKAAAAIDRYLGW
jgi:NADPH-dependent glutamate synthase beta subunit-like oxidoreductase